MDELETKQQEELESQMSFLDHLDELRKRLVKSVIIIVIAFVFCFKFSDTIYHFLAVPIVRALTESQRREVPLNGVTGDEKVLPLSSLKPGDRGRYVFDRATKLGTGVVQPGTSVDSVVANDAEGKIVLFTDEPIFTVNSVIPKGANLPIERDGAATDLTVGDERLIVTTAQEAFTLYVTVSLYSAIALSIPFLLIQVWGFISPALYKHERGYVIPFVILSTISFVAGAAFAYYILFPPAVRFLLGVAEEFRPLLRATDYFDLITIIILAMGLIFQMPAVSYVLSRIGILSAALLVKSWKLALVIILILAAVVSPTGDITNMMLFAAPMMVLYVFSIFIAWFFGKKRQTDVEV